MRSSLDKLASSCLPLPYSAHHTPLPTHTHSPNTEPNIDPGSKPLRAEAQPDICG